jgi:hypothetical protein
MTTYHLAFAFIPKAMASFIASGYSPAGNNGGGSSINRRENNDRRQPPAQLYQYVGATCFVFFSGAIYFYWLAFPLINTVFTDRIPQLGTPGAGYLTSRYGWDWWCIAILSWQALLPMTLVFALTNNKIETWSNLHRFLTQMAILFTLLIFLTLTFRWAFYCNTSYSGLQSACNDYRWCCVFYPSPWCPNTTPCTPNYVGGDLSRNAEMTQHWAFTMVFFVLACWHYSTNRNLRNNGVLLQ